MFVFVTSVLLIIIILCLVYSSKNSKYLKNIPGPKPNIIFGNTIDFLFLPTYEAAMGIKINAQNNTTSEYVKSVKTMCGILTDRMFSPLHSIFYPLTLNYYREKKALKVLHSYTESIIEKRINKMSTKTIDEDNNINDIGKKKRLAFLDLLLKSSLDGESLSRLEIREEVDTFMFEGQDTTSAAISFTLYALANHDDVQEKVFLEQKEIFGGDKNPIPTITQLQEMKYLELVIKESLRLYPSVPFYGRKLSEDLEWDGILYPKGCNIMVFTFAIQRDPEYYSDPEKFIPERFLDIRLVNPYVYCPFSAGPRNCIGQKFAMLELKSTLSKVIRNFILSPAQPEHTLRYAPETILVPKTGVHISLKKREWNK